MAIRAVLFDMDGTIWSSPVNWPEVRRAIGVPPEARTIIDYLSSLPPEERERGTAILERYEALGVETGSPMPGAAELIAFLRAHSVVAVLITNNSRASAEAVLERNGLIFDRVFTREDGALKPDPEALLGPLRALGLSPGEALAIGDSHLDLLAARRAGIADVILVAPKEWSRDLLPPDLSFREAADLFEARTIVSHLLALGSSPS